MPDAKGYPTWDEQWEAYKKAKAAYDVAYLRWNDNGKLGDPPPRPVRPHTPGWGVPPHA